MIPKLRFPEFTDEWQPVKLSQFLIPELREVNKPTRPYLALGLRSHFKGTFQKPDSDPTKIAMDTLFEAHAGDFIINTTFAWEGALAIATAEDEGGLVSHRFPTYIFNEKVSFNNFFRYVYPTDRMKYNLGLASPGGAGRNRVLNKGDFLAIEVSIPNIAEQRKIADLLTTVDKKIISIDNKVELLKRYKRGVMQKIFTKQIRFKDETGNDYPAWKNRSAKDITSLIKDGTHGTHVDTEGSSYKLLSAKNIKNGRIIFDDSDRTISESEFNTIQKNYSLQEGDLLLTIVGTIGNVAIWNEELANFAFQRSVAFLRFTDLIPLYAYQVLSAPAFQKELKRRSVISAQPGVYLGDIAKILIQVPCTNEQQKIAHFLGSIDDKIKAEETKLVSAKKFKDALLQRMFI